jgi:S-adenosylhomocysteine hydrolase
MRGIPSSYNIFSTQDHAAAAIARDLAAVFTTLLIHGGMKAEEIYEKIGKVLLT